MSDVSEIATVAWGYTMADINRLAWGACKRNGRSMTLDTEERYATAWHGIVVALYRTDDDQPRSEAPHYSELFTAGLDALDDAIDAEFQNHGWNKKKAAEAPRYAMYWRPSKEDRTDGFTDHLVETLSLPVALSLLTGEQYEAVITLAAHDNDMVAAAAALGMSKSGFYNRIRVARDTIKAVWVGDDETPVQRRMPTDTCRSGHDRATHGKIEGDGRLHCQECRRIANRKAARKRRNAAETTLQDDQAA